MARSADTAEERVERHERLYGTTFRRWAAVVGENCKRLRAERDWTQKQTAVRSGVALYLYQRVESGRCNVTLSTLARLCEGFSVDLPEFVAPVVVPRRRRLSAAK